MKKALVFLCVAALLFGLLPMSAFAGTVDYDFGLSMSASAVDGSGDPRALDALEAGDIVTVSVSIPSGIDACSIGIHLNFDNTLLECTNVSFGNALTTPYYIPSLQAGWSAHEFSDTATANTNGYAAVWAAYKDSDGKIANTTTSVDTPAICTVTFEVKSGVSGTATFSVDAIQIASITSIDPETGDPVTEFYAVGAPSVVSATIPEVLSSVSVNAIAIDFGATAVTSVSGTGYTGDVIWTGVTGGNTISAAGTYEAEVTLTPAGAYAFTASAVVSYGGMTLTTAAQTINNCSVKITSQTASQIVFTVSRTLTAPIAASPAYTAEASGSTTKIATTYGTAKTAVVTFANTAESAIDVTVESSDTASFSLSATSVTVPASSTASVTVTLKNTAVVGNYSTTITGAYTYGGVDITAQAAVSGSVAKAVAAIVISPVGTLAFDGDAVTAGTSGADITYSYTGDGAVTVTWYADNSGTRGSSLSGAPSAAGTYWIGAKAAAGTNYLAVSEQYMKFSISASSAALTYANTNYTGSGTEASPFTKTYDGAAFIYVKDAAGVTLTAESGGSAITPGYAYAWYTTGGTSLGSAAPTGAGSYYVVISISDANYAGSTTVYFTIGKVTLTPSVASVDSKPYDGTTTATGTLSLSDAVNSEAPTATGTFTWTSAASGTTTVNVSGIALTGSWDDNYTVSPDSLSNQSAKGASITGTQLAVSGTAVDIEKVYDGTTTASVTNAGTLSGVASGDDVSLEATAAYNSKTVGAEKTITITYALTGDDAANYIAPASSSVAGMITQKQLSISDSDLTTVDIKKVYDGTATAEVTNDGTLAGVIAGDTVILDVSANYGSELVGTEKHIDVTYAISGADAGNYSAPLFYRYSDAAEVTPLQLTASGTVVTTSKPNDGTATAAVTTIGTLDNVAADDTVTLDATAVYENEDTDTGTGKTILVTYTIGGADAGNYTAPVSYVYTTTGEITKGGLVSISVSASPTTTAYNDGASLDTTGLIIMAHYFDSNDDEAISGYAVIYDNGYLGGNTATGRVTASAALICGDEYVTVAYGGKYCQLGGLTVTATITWKVDGETAETDELVVRGTTPSYTGTPTKTDDTGAYTYAFLGWLKTEGGVQDIGTIYYTTYDAEAAAAVTELGYTYAAIPLVAASVTYTAAFSQTAVTHSVNFYNGGTLLDTATVRHNGDAVYGGDTPVKPEDETNTYTFDKWVTETGESTAATLTAVTDDMNVYASFTEVPKPVVTEYDVVFKNDSVTLGTDTVVSGGTAIYTGATPTRVATAQYTYTFDGWVTTNGGAIPADLTGINANKTVYASFSATPRTYTVSWIVDGAVTTQTLDYGDALAYPGDAPEKTDTAQYDYTFSEWNTAQDGLGETAPATVSGNAVYYAVFAVSVQSYTVTWNIEGATSTAGYEYGGTPSYDGTPGKENYAFVGWSDDTIYDADSLPAVTKNVTYTAVFTQNDIYTVTFKNYDESVIAVVKAADGSTLTAPTDPVRAADAQHTYAFGGWNDGTTTYGAASLPSVTADATYTAVYTSAARSYTITWVVGGASSTTAYDYGEVPSYGSTPEKAAVADRFTYAFAGWKSGTETYASSLPAVTHDTVYVALFTETAVKHTLSIAYIYAGGGAAAEPYTAQIGYGGTYSVASPTIAGYTPSIDVVGGIMGESDQSFTVTYTKKTFDLTVSFEYDESNRMTGGTAADPVTVSIPYGSAATIAVPALLGQTAWYGGSPVSGGTISYTMSTAADQNITVTYVADTYRVYLRLSGDPIADGAAYLNAFSGCGLTDMDDGLYCLAYEYGETLVLPTPSVSDWYFNGWMGAPSTMPANDITLTGSFSRGAYTFVYRVLDEFGILRSLGFTYHADSASADLGAIETDFIAAFELNHPGWHISGGFHSAVTLLSAGGTIYRVAEATAATHSLNITYEYSGGAVISAYNTNLPDGANYSVTSPAEEGYTADKPVVSGTLAADTSVVVTYTKNSYTLTVKYRYADGSTAADSNVSTVAYGEDYSAASPVIAGFAASRSTVTGSMPAMNFTEIVYYTSGEKILNIHYQFADGSPAANSYTGVFDVNEAFNVSSPELTGYRANIAAVSGRMDLDGESYTVVYSPCSYTLTITYQYSDGSKLAAGTYGGISVDANGRYTVAGNYNDTYSITSPVIDGYTISQPVVSGTLTASTSVTVTYTSTSGGIIGGIGGIISGGGDEEEPETVELGDITATLETAGGTAVLGISDTDLAAAVAAASDGSIDIDLRGYEGVTAVALPAALVIAAADASLRLSVVTDGFTITLGSEAVANLAAQLGSSDTLTLSLTVSDSSALNAAQLAALSQNAMILDLIAVITVCGADGAPTGEIKVAEPGANVTVTIPYSPAGGLNTANLMVYRLNEDGSVEYLETAYASGALTFVTDRFSIYVAASSPMYAYTDCDPNGWYRTAVDYVLDNGLMNGTGDNMFSPGASASRAMIVTILWRLAGEPAGANAPFTDLTQGWYQEAVGWALQNGITTGKTASTFEPDAPMTREQFAAFLYRYAELQGLDMSARADLAAYSDTGDISAYAADYIEWAVAQGIITGRTTTTIVPGGNATRAEMATMLMRFCENVLP